MVAMVITMGWSSGGSPIKITDSPGSGAVQGWGQLTRKHTHSHPESWWRGPWTRGDLGLRQVQERGRKRAAPLSPAPETVAVLRMGEGMGMGGGKQSLPPQGCPCDRPHTLTPDAEWGFCTLGRRMWLDLRCWGQANSGLQPWIPTFLAVCL